MELENTINNLWNERERLVDKCSKSRDKIKDFEKVREEEECFREFQNIRGQGVEGGVKYE